MTELTNAIRKQIHSLAESKYRRQFGLFAAEGTKCVGDTAGHFHCRILAATAQWLDSHCDIVDKTSAESVFAVRADDLSRMSSLKTAPEVIAVYEIKQPVFEAERLRAELVVALDRIQDPGNLGTIVRLCDWFGVNTIIASEETVDLWNPKAVQATMGAISRVSVIYGDLAAMIEAIRPEAIYGTFLDGTSIYGAELSANGVVIMGNEGRGISDAIAGTVNRRLLIPSYPAGITTSESLNVATATAITLSEFRRRVM